MERFGISVGGQLLETLRFAGVGVLLGVWYDLFRLLRLFTHPTARRVFVQDLLFFASAAAVTLLCALSISSGQVRGYHLLALGAGFFCYYQTVGRLLYALARRTARGLTRLAAMSTRAGRRAVQRMKFRKAVPAEEKAEKI